MSLPRRIYARCKRAWQSNYGTLREIRQGLRFAIWRGIFRRRCIVFLTFADGKRFTSARIEREARRIRWFDRIICHNANSLGDDFVRDHREHLQHERGYGFWVWKPYILLKEITCLDDGDILVYADSGCTIQPTASIDLRELLMQLTESDDQLMVADDGVGYKIKNWTKAELLLHLNLLERASIFEERHWEAGRLVIVKTDKNVAFLRKWYSLAANISLIDESPSALPEHPEFIEHRHDQAIFGLLALDKHIVTGLERVIVASRLTN